MSYDWEKIFESKTNKELYDIVIGRRILSQEAVKFAKTELENRNFNFSNMEANKAGWEISSLIEEEVYANSGISFRRAAYIPYKLLMFIVSGIAIVYYILNKYTEYDIPLEAAVYFAGISAFYILLNNFIFRIQNQARNKRIEKIRELKEKLDKESPLTEESPVFKEMERHEDKIVETRRTYKYIVIGVMVILVLIMILSNL
jgi:hypothetical protein